MGTETITRPIHDGERTRSGRPPKLTFGQRVGLLAGILILGGLPGAVCAAGSVRHENEPRPGRNQPAIMAHGVKMPPELPSGACIVETPGEVPRPTMNIRHKGNE